MALSVPDTPFRQVNETQEFAAINLDLLKEAAAFDYEEDACSIDESS